MRNKHLRYHLIQDDVIAGGRSLLSIGLLWSYIRGRGMGHSWAWAFTLGLQPAEGKGSLLELSAMNSSFSGN